MFSGLGGLNPELYKTNCDLEDDDSVDSPDFHNGRVWYALEYDTASERLIVTLVKARNLSERDNNDCDSANTFVRLSLFPDERRMLQSKPRKMSARLRYDEPFGFQVRVIIPVSSSHSIPQSRLHRGAKRPTLLCDLSLRVHTHTSRLCFSIVLNVGFCTLVVEYHKLYSYGCLRYSLQILWL